MVLHYKIVTLWQINYILRRKVSKMYIWYIVQCNDVLMALFQLTNRNPDIPCNEIWSQNLHYKNRYYVMNQNLWSLPFYNCHSPSYTMSNLCIYTWMNQAYFCKNFHGLDTHCSILVPCIRQYQHIDHSLSEKKRKVTHESWVMIRVIHGPKDRVTPLDLRAQNLGVNVEFST